MHGQGFSVAPSGFRIIRRAQLKRLFRRRATARYIVARQGDARLRQQRVRELLGVERPDRGKCIYRIIHLYTRSRQIAGRGKGGGVVHLRRG